MCWGCEGVGEQWLPEKKVRCTHQASSQDTSVLTVEAVDSDKGINDIVTYRITSENLVVPWRRLG